MNYLQIFAKGGKIDTKAIKSEIARIFMLEDSPEKVEQLWQDAVNTYGSEEGVLSEIFKQVGENPSDESVQQAMMNVLNYTPMEESQMFKCGGKLQQLVTKFGKGGGIDCGCGGTKLQEGGRTISADGSITIVNPNTAQADTLGRYSYPSTNGKFQLLSNGERNATVWDNTGGFPIARYANETFMQNHPVRTFLGGYKKAPAGYFENIVDRVNNRFDQNGVPVKQDGGTVNYEEMPGHDIDTRLTRRQARELARVNGMSENNEQFSFAMANAMNAARAMGLRGAEARQRAREMAAGIKPTERSIVDRPTQLNVSAPVLNTPAAITAPEQLTLPETQRTLDALLAETNSGLTRSLNRSRTLNNKSQQEARSLTDNINALFNKKHPDIVVGPIKENFTVESSENQRPTSTISEETNNSGYYRPSNEELERKQQRWNNYWNRPINRPQYQAIDETYEATPGYAKTDYTLRLNEYLNRPASNWGYQPVDESQNTSGYYNSSMSNSDSNARRAERQLAQAKRAEINAFNQWNTWHGINGVAEAEIPTYKYGKVELTDDGYRYVPYQKCGGKVEKGQFGFPEGLPKIQKPIKQTVVDNYSQGKRDITRWINGNDTTVFIPMGSSNKRIGEVMILRSGNDGPTESYEWYGPKYREFNQSKQKKTSLDFWKSWNKLIDDKLNK